MAMHRALKGVRLTVKTNRHNYKHGLEGKREISVFEGRLRNT